MTSIAFLHTAEVHIETFKGLLESAEVSQTHRLHPEWLGRARETGLTPALCQRVADELRELAKDHDAVLCTCSTLGPIADEIGGNVLRIDRRLMEAASTHKGRVIVAICLESTLSPTLELLKEVSGTLEYTVANCAAAWPFFEVGDMDGFATSTAQTITDTCENLDDIGCIILAQASMAVAESHLADLGVPVLSSPRLAAAAALQLAKS